MVTSLIFYRINILVSGKKLAGVPILIHIMFFFDLYYVIFWFSDITFVLEMFFRFWPFIFLLKVKIIINKFIYHIYLQYYHS